jgi:hypothetical protein
MKKKTLLLASALFAGTTFAQDLTSKKGETILPEAGDWAISFDAVPFLDYFGQMLSNAGAVSPTVGYTNGYPWAIKGKMFKDEKTAYRAGIRLGFGSTTYRNMIADASVTTPPTFPTAPSEVEDSYKAGYNGIVLTGGLEMRRGKTRLQGYYGGELWIGFGGSKDTYTYGNALSTSTTNPVSASASTDWSAWGGNNMGTDPYGNTSRKTEEKMSMMTFGLRGFIGVEYFILPKISIGAEYGWGFGLSSMKTSYSAESLGVDGGGNLATGAWDVENKTSGFAIDSDIQNNATGLAGASGNLNIIFHF